MTTNRVEAEKAESKNPGRVKLCWDYLTGNAQNDEWYFLEAAALCLATFFWAVHLASPYFSRDEESEPSGIASLKWNCRLVFKQLDMPDWATAEMQTAVDKAAVSTLYRLVSNYQFRLESMAKQELSEARCRDFLNHKSYQELLALEKALKEEFDRAQGIGEQGEVYSLALERRETLAKEISALPSFYIYRTFCPVWYRLRFYGLLVLLAAFVISCLKIWRVSHRKKNNKDSSDLDSSDTTSSSSSGRSGDERRSYSGGGISPDGYPPYFPPPPPYRQPHDPTNPSTWY